jgi:hypothetical protein
MRKGNTNVVKMSDLTVQLREHGLDLILLQQAFHVVQMPNDAQTPVDPSTMITVYTGKTKREIQAWIYGYQAAWEMWPSHQLFTFPELALKGENNA